MRLGTAGVDPPTIHQVKQGTEPHQLHLDQGQVEIGEADVGQAGEGGLDGGVYAAGAGVSFGASVVISRLVPRRSASVIAER